MQELILMKKKYTITYLILIIIFGLGLRFYYTPFDVPIATDGFFSFVYAILTLSSTELPIGITTTNTGWSNILSMFFLFGDMSEPINLMQIQRSLSIVFSTLTIIPALFIFQKFVNTKYALFGVLVLAIEPRLLLLSIEGINYSLFLFLIVSATALFLKKTNLTILLSFVCIALASLIRYESILLLIPFSIMYLIQNNKKKSYLKLIGMIVIFTLIILPMGVLRMEATNDYCYASPLGEICGKDGIVNNFLDRFGDIENKIVGVADIDDPIYNQEKPMIDHFVVLSISNLIKFLGLILIPIFVFFISIFMINLVRKRNFLINYDHKFLIFSVIITILPGLYAYGRNIEETKYVLIAIPVLCLISSYSLKIISKNNIIFITIISLVIITSITFIELEKKDNVFQYESYIISKKIFEISNGVNPYEYSGFIKNAKLENEWKELNSLDDISELNSFEKIAYGKTESLEEYIKSSNEKLTHIVVYEKNNVQPEFLTRIYDENKINYLEIVFDSKDHNFKNNVKIFEINYDLLDNNH